MYTHVFILKVYALFTSYYRDSITILYREFLVEIITFTLRQSAQESVVGNYYAVFEII